jgi:hypothetical protein
MPKKSPHTRKKENGCITQGTLKKDVLDSAQIRPTTGNRSENGTASTLRNTKNTKPSVIKLKKMPISDCGKKGIRNGKERKTLSLSLFAEGKQSDQTNAPSATQNASRKAIITEVTNVVLTLLGSAARVICLSIESISVPCGH